MRDLSDGVNNKDVDKTMNLIDNSQGIILAGLEENEIFKGPEEIKKQLKQFFNKPIRLSCDLKRIEMDPNNQTAWIYSYGPATISSSDGSSSIITYRFTVVLIGVNSYWKIRLLYRSVPEQIVN